MQFRKNLARSAAVIISAAIMALFGTAEYYSLRLPESVTAESSAAVSFVGYPELKVSELSENNAEITLFGAIPIKNVSVNRSEAPTLIAGGGPFGIKLLMEGVMVTELGTVDSPDGKICPAEKAGIKLGDVIGTANGQPVTSNGDLQRIIGESGGDTLVLTINRGGTRLDARLTPAYSKKAKSYKGGMWVRDSIAGIGTMTFIDKATNRYAGLGHPVCDSDTGEVIPIHSGEAVPVRITDAKRGESGIPGELRGSFVHHGSYGTLEKNTGCGVFGSLTREAVTALDSGQNEYKLGYRQEIEIGDASILTTVSGSEPREYSARIEQINYNSREKAKNMVIRITDPELIEASGGIVQGMSGSPIIQNGKLVGAVTHVFVADPTRGYAIFAENMYNSMCE